MLDYWYRYSMQATAATVVAGILFTGTLAAIANAATAKPKPVVRLQLIEGGRKA